MIPGQSELFTPTIDIDVARDQIWGRIEQIRSEIGSLTLERQGLALQYQALEDPEVADMDAQLRNMGGLA